MENVPGVEVRAVAKVTLTVARALELLGGLGALPAVLRGPESGPNA